VIPNSKLSRDIIEKIYSDEKRISNPIYTTNINYNKNMCLMDNFNSRQYDVVFCCYSWSRQCKNATLVKKLIGSFGDRFKIIVIGKNFDSSDEFVSNKNITLIDNVPNEQIGEYFKKSKTLVIPSYYDSNPNVLIEAISFGCNIVTSRNVGNNEFLSPASVVENHDDISEWEEKIIGSLNIRFTNNCMEGTNIKSQLIRLTKNITAKIQTVGIYKINPIWDNTKLPKFQYFTFGIKKDDSFVNQIVFNDIYFIITYKIGISCSSDDINYIIVDETIETNECYYVYNTLSYYENFVKIWKIKNRNDLFFFDQADLYFLRGNYHKFYNIFIPDKAQVIFYPATSFKQNIKLNRIEPLENKYSVVLIHEDSRYKKLYQLNNTVLFKKFTPSTFINMNIARIYDFCFIATENQITKNHHLFLSFLEYLEEQNLHYNVIFIGDLDKITLDTDYSNKFKSIKLEFKKNLSRTELIEIYNKSRNNLIFSGRDAFPRVITESSACGCFNIVLDTLDDGKSLCDGILGVLVGDKEVEKEFLSGSLSYKPDKILWDKIIKQIDKTRNYNQISIRFKKEFSLVRLIDEINKNLKNLLVTNKDEYKNKIEFVKENQIDVEYNNNDNNKNNVLLNKI
jgi:hypothetical protein